MQKEDCKYMFRCLQLAKKGEYYVAPNPMVGAVLVMTTSDETGNQKTFIIGEGWHQRFGESHAEVNCIREAERRGYKDFSRCTLYVSLEPCSHYGKTPPCAGLIVSKGIRRVVVGMKDPNPLVAGKGIKILRDAGIEVETGILEKECRMLNRRFLCLQEKKRPYVILKWAETADGYIDYERDMKNKNEIGRQLVISNQITKQLVHKMRAENMSIMVGTRTALLDNPSLRVTRWSGRNPIRIVLDRRGLIPEDYKVFTQDAQTIVYKDNTDIRFVLNDLADKGIHSVLIEGGRCLLNHVIESGLWDEAHIEVANKRIGSGVKSPLFPREGLKCERTIGGSRLYKLVRWK